MTEDAPSTGIIKRWFKKFFPPQEPRMVKAMCNNCFQVIAIPAQGEWWCSDCEGKFHRMKS